MFCPSCGSEYVEGVTRCADCDTVLVAKLPKFEDDDEPLTLVRVSGPVEAPMIQELLEHNGIKVILQGEAAASELPAMGDLNEVRVWVPESNKGRAHELIEAFFDSSGEASEEEAADETPPR